jgi:hypothetical protein
MPSSLNETLAANGDDAVFGTHLRGEYLSCYEQDGLVEVELYLDNTMVEVHTVERFVTLNYKKYDYVKFRNLSGKENKIIFFHGLGVYQASQDRALVTVDNTGAALTVRNVADGATVLSDVVVAAGAKVKVFDANLSRLEAYVQSLGENTSDVRIAPHGDVAANAGEVLVPWGSAMYKTKTEVWVYNGSSESVTLVRNELLLGVD